MKAMKYRDLAKALKAQGCTAQPGKGDHEKWYCPDGNHMAVITKTNTVSPGVVRDTVQKTVLPSEGVALMTDRYTVHAKRWAEGWELHIDGIGVTQSRTLATAEQQVRDYLETLLDIDASGASIDIVPELGDLAARAERAREEAERAAELQRAAAAHTREVVRDLRGAGLSVADVATVMHVSRGRVSQLIEA